MRIITFKVTTEAQGDLKDTLDAICSHIYDLLDIRGTTFVKYVIEDEIKELKNED